MRNPICMLQQLNWMRMEIACGSLSDLTGWLKRWCSFCRERKSLCLPLSACQCNYNHRGTRGGPWYPVDYGLNNMLEMRSVSLGLLCVRTGAVMYVYFCICLVRWIGSSTYWFPDCTSTKKKRNKSFVWPIHNTNFGLKYAPEGFKIDPSPKSHLWKFSFSPTPLIPSRSLRISMHFSSCLSCHLPKEASGGQSHSATVLLCAAKLFAEITVEVFFSLRSHWMSGSSLHLKQSPHDQTPTSLRVRER